MVNAFLDLAEGRAKRKIPSKLNIGDEIRVIAPSRSMCILSDEVIETAKKRLENIGFKVTFGKNVLNSIGEDYNCASIEDRIEDLHEAFKDKNVKAIIVGRAEKNCEMNDEKWARILKSKKELSNIPIVINANFGHTTPIFTFPIGGYAKVKVDKEIKIEIKD